MRTGGCLQQSYTLTFNSNSNSNHYYVCLKRIAMGTDSLTADGNNSGHTPIHNIPN